MSGGPARGCGAVGGRVCPYDTIRTDGHTNLRLLLALLLAQPPAEAQTPADDEPIVVSTEHPRLLLRPARLRLLRRERERKSARWQQFHLFLAGHAAMPETGFASALYYQVAGDAEAGREAIAWALAPAADLRQQALVYDWCQDLLSEAQKRELAARMRERHGRDRGRMTPSRRCARARWRRWRSSITCRRCPRQELERVVRGWWMTRWRPNCPPAAAWWRAKMPTRCTSCCTCCATTPMSTCASRRAPFFRGFPTEHLVSYYPAPMEAPENEYYIGAARRTGEPDLRLAALSRAAELAMVAYDANAAGNPIAARLADARPLPAARRLRRALRIPVGQPVSARVELRPCSAGLAQCRFRPAVRTVRVGRIRRIGSALSTA